MVDLLYSHEAGQSGSKSARVPDHFFGNGFLRKRRFPPQLNGSINTKYERQRCHAEVRRRLRAEASQPLVVIPITMVARECV